MEWGSSEFHKTLLGKSVGKNFVQLVAGLDSLISPKSKLKVSSGPKIIDVDGERAYINVGLVDSVANGNKYGVWDQGRELKDPSTGIVLGSALMACAFLIKWLALFQVQARRDTLVAPSRGVPA